MAEHCGMDVVSEYLSQNAHLKPWLESLRELSETNKHWQAREEFVLRNLENFPSIRPGTLSPDLDKLLSLSKVWANHVFLGCRYPQPVMDKIAEMSDGITVNDAPVRKTRDEIMGKGKRPAEKGNESMKDPEHLESTILVQGTLKMDLMKEEKIEMILMSGDTAAVS